MAPQYQVYSLPGHEPEQTGLHRFGRLRPGVAVVRVELGPELQPDGLDGGAVGPGTLGQLDLYETPQGTTGPANADAEISANSTVSKDISLLDTKGSEVLLGETLMVPIAELHGVPASAVRVADDEPAAAAAVRGRSARARTCRSTRRCRTSCPTCSVRRCRCPRSRAGPSTGTVPAAVAGILQQAQTDYTNALAALKAGNLAQFQTDINRDAGRRSARPSR